ncbi:prepilin-type N-terminal cleavage/methylation domain-containing protein [Shewanella schlegeliana]|uniref:Prepilin-type N-terminal cleavage/methylation domain-containing protein n=1 Tax=Shewanella schlegeliana TaxID=190308 RepID=A0ABS1SZ95_9GAMM|nr:prepilin-type N-terminal cleavage/methylation domain-containing protein [Shewanella schlegeliana]MBL4913858.1 prepilin-type N-terminal cleavage/methylation domain-containing protein [Shewanella schlegeliana]MCL1108758.1 prepilin-type N-terminal cleavage/methylation domain-containing protein [Shewanella schlegeliana]GIU26161.1 type IV pilin [Shewanella schlegeliana]
MLLNRYRIRGFTLLELTAVIIILGIIAVIATSKYLSFSRDAHIAQIKGVAAQISKQNQLIHSKSVIDNIERLTGCSFQCADHPNWDVRVGQYFVDVSGTRVYVSLGYPLSPLSSGDAIGDNYREVFGLPETSFLFTVVPTNLGSVAIVPIEWQSKLSEIREGDFQCHVEYSAPTSVREYSVRTYTEDC